jgi:hypothetical protein
MSNSAQFSASINKVAIFINSNSKAVGSIQLVFENAHFQPTVSGEHTILTIYPNKAEMNDIIESFVAADKYLNGM